MDDLITRASDGFRAIIDRINAARKDIATLKKDCPPVLAKQRYYTSGEVCNILSISRRTLQDYRDKRIIPFTTVAGKVLYKESDIQRMLADNYCPSFDRL